MKRFILGGLALIGSLALGYAIAPGNERDAQTAQTTELAQRLEQLERSVSRERTQAQTQLARAIVSSPALATPTAPAPNAASTPAVPAALEPSEEENPQPIEVKMAAERQARERYRAVLDDAIRNEPEDRGWRAQTERELSQSIASAKELGARVEAMECRSTLCRVVFNHDSADAQQTFLDRIAGSPGFRLRGKAHLEYGDGIPGAKTFIYLARAEDGFPPAP